MDLFSRHSLKTDISRCSPSQMFLYKGGLKISSKVTGEHPCRKVNYWNHASAWVLSCKFTVHCQNIFSKKHLWGASSVFHKDIFSQKVLRNIAVKLLLRFFSVRVLVSTESNNSIILSEMQNASRRKKSYLVSSQ